ncbi:MAG: hypothetical protein U9Q20_03195 [Campylobacterota bacterium]|nr:hypothetical protein [Campylobacterota bacterium]
MRKALFLLFISFSFLNAKDFFYENNKRVDLKRDLSKSSTYQIRYFKNKKNESIAVKNRILIKLNSVAAITAMILEYDLNIFRKINDKKFILEVKDINDIFWISNKINSKTAVSYAYPIYINKTKKAQRAMVKKSSKKDDGIGKAKVSASGADISSAFKNR